jgi:hypothetical protein
VDTIFKFLIAPHFPKKPQRSPAAVRTNKLI